MKISNKKFLVIPTKLFAMCLLICWYSPATAQSFEQVAPGAQHICTLDSSGQVECTTTPVATRFLPPDDLPLMREISAGQQHTCGITLDGGVECWGADAFGVLQVPEFDASVVSLSAGINHTCAIDENNQVQCWGLGTNGQLDVPDVPGGFVKVDAGREASCGIDVNGDIHCWSTIDSFVFDQPVEGPFIDLDLSVLSACGLTSNGDIDCFVLNDFVEITPPTNGPYSDLTVTIGSICGLGMDQLLDCSFREPTMFSADPMIEEFPLEVAFSSIERSAQVAGATPVCGVRAESGTISCFGDGPSEGFLPAPPGASSVVDANTASSFNLQLTAQVYSSTQVELFWNRVPSVFPQISVEVFRDDELIATTPNNISLFFNSNFGPNDEARYRVRTVDDAGNRGEFSNEILVNRITGVVTSSVQPIDNPRVDPAVRVSNINQSFFVGASTVLLTWQVDNPNDVEIAGFEVRVDDELLGFVENTVFSGELISRNVCNVFTVAALASDGSILDFSANDFSGSGFMSACRN